ncbi:hypothetical protein Dimus_004251 [Dionaea muscipula]
MMRFYYGIINLSIPIYQLFVLLTSARDYIPQLPTYPIYFFQIVLCCFAKSPIAASSPSISISPSPSPSLHLHLNLRFSINLHLHLRFSISPFSFLHLTISVSPSPPPSMITFLQWVVAACLAGWGIENDKTFC